MNSKPEYLSRSEYDFFKTLYQENKDKQQDKISFENFSDIIYANKNINKQLLPEILTKVKTRIEKKRNISKGLYLSKIYFIFYIEEDEYYQLVQDIFREQNLKINSEDPEMQKLFYLLSGDKEYISKKKLADIINLFELPLDINVFFAPVAKKQDIEFDDFCMLFKKRPGVDDLIIQTFYSTFIALDQKSEQMEKADNYFPIKYIPH